MAAKKNKPALFELINKGRLKPDSKGSLAAPSWFNSKPVKSVAESTVSQESPGGPGAAQKDAQPTPATASRLTPGRLARQFRPMLSENRLNISVPYWLVGLIGLALLLAVLVSYRLGQASGMARSADASTGDLREAGPADQSGESDNLSTRKELPPTERKVQTESAPGPTAPAEGTGAQAPPTAAQRTGRVLVICGAGSTGELAAVKDFFLNEGVQTNIGWDGDRYILYSQLVFQSSRDREALVLQQRVTDLGARYESEKDKDAPIFKAATFKSAYPANLSSIETLNN